jgi:hypothetical protein
LEIGKSARAALFFIVMRANKVAGRKRRDEACRHRSQAGRTPQNPGDAADLSTPQGIKMNFEATTWRSPESMATRLVQAPDQSQMAF